MGTVDHWQADAYAAHARFVSEHGVGVVDLLDPRPGERILDLGCGDGALTAQIAARGASVLGVDASPAMVAAARARGLEAETVRGEALAFDGEFDAVFSNAALHWMTQPEAVALGVARALKPGGRFVAEMGGHGNVAAIRTALIAALAWVAAVETDLTSVWYFPTATAQAALLHRAGLMVESIVLFPRLTPVAAGLDAWLDTLAAPALALAPETLRPKVRARATALARPALCDGEGQWTADYVRLRFVARKP
jgi:trans-aconitate methyltransferase